jgi:hypothetical protein
MMMIDTVDQKSAKNASLAWIATTDRRCHAILIAIIVLLCLVDAVWLQFSNVSLDLPSLLWQLPTRLLFIGLFWVYAYLRPEPRLAMTCLAIVEISMFVLPATIFSFLTMRFGQPLADDTYASWDAALYFNWPTYVEFILHRPWLALPLYTLYASSVAQIALICLALGFSRKSRNLMELIGVLMISGCVTVIFGAAFPALGGYDHFHLPDYGIADFIPAIQESRDRSLHLINFDHVEGLVMFPSYHTVISVSLIIASWDLRYLRYPVLIGNLALLASVPVFGAHYLVDILSGIALTVLTFALWRYLTGLASSADASRHQIAATKS